MSAQPYNHIVVRNPETKRSQYLDTIQYSVSLRDEKEQNRLLNKIKSRVAKTAMLTPHINFFFFNLLSSGFKLSLNISPHL
jgi:hypothetical protein